MMTGTYAMGAPWLQFAQSCGPESEGGPDRLREAWFTLMTGGRGRRQHPFAHWNMHSGPAPFMPPWAATGRGWRGMKARRGDVRAAILAVLAVVLVTYLAGYLSLGCRLLLPRDGSENPFIRVYPYGWQTAIFGQQRKLNRSCAARR